MALADDQKSVFRDELNPGRNSATGYAAIALRAEDKLAIIQGEPPLPLQIPPSLRTWLEIVQPDDKRLASAAPAAFP
jgi:hypothetical protein